MLGIKDVAGTGTTEYKYSVTGVLVSTGQTVTVSGHVDRIHSGNDTDSTMVALNFGGIVKNVVVTVTDSVVTGITVRSFDFQVAARL